MNKYIFNMSYRMTVQLFVTLVWVASYAAIMFLVFYSLIKANIINSYDGGLVYRICIIITLQFIMSIRFKEDFDFLLTLNNTRQEIIMIFSGVAILFSALYSGLIVLERMLIDYLNPVLGFGHIIDPFHLFAGYHTDSLLLQFLFFFMLSASISAVALTLGIWFYRFGKAFASIFWVVFSLVITVLLNLLIVDFYWIEGLSRVHSSMLTLLKEFNLLASSGYLLLVTMAFGMIAFLSIRRLPQN